VVCIALSIQIKLG